MSYILNKKQANAIVKSISKINTILESIEDETIVDNNPDFTEEELRLLRASIVFYKTTMELHNMNKEEAPKLIKLQKKVSRLLNQIS